MNRFACTVACKRWHKEVDVMHVCKVLLVAPTSRIHADPLLQPDVLAVLDHILLQHPAALPLLSLLKCMLLDQLVFQKQGCERLLLTQPSASRVAAEEALVSTPASATLRFFLRLLSRASSGRLSRRATRS